MRLERAWLALACAAFVAVSGCVVILDPIGNDASVEGQWLINGATPTAASCASLGITHVRVRVRDGSRIIDPAALVFDCADGGFDTRPNLVLADGTWTLQLVALNADAPSGMVEVSEGPEEIHDTLAEGGHIVLDNVVNFEGTPSGFLAGSWTIDGETPTSARCDALAINEVHLEFLDGSGSPDPLTTLKYPCTDGGFTEPLDPGSYEIRVVAVDLSGNTLAMAMNETVTIAIGSTTTINGGAPVDFSGVSFNPLGTDSALNATWTIGGLSADDKSCDAVAGTSVDLIFYAADDTTFADGAVVHMGAPCADGAYASGTPILAAGDYLFRAELKATGGAVISRVETGSPFTVTAGTPVDLSLDFRLDSSTIHAYLEWESPTVVGSYLDCAGAGVTAMHTEVYFDDGSAGGLFVGGQDVGMTVGCTDFINFMGTDTGGALAPGNYDIVAEGYLGTTKTWQPMGTCTLSIDAAGGLGLTTCRADYVP